jgi:hypothetical protein
MKVLYKSLKQDERRNKMAIKMKNEVVASTCAVVVTPNHVPQFVTHRT